ncbi:hypothetical protein [Rhodococcus sp. ARC_M6]|uniref:hypothetical protein n=1 Tax=Rhodococcus sp. ARC_M6 TaxID=2928852 RepID=UPI001FB2544C|nr:hypothetical protein [Rhodococcus sp. ARC_M6]MCJ0907049.1 hypothetical protein [Rhodococcus sp. ARC_M6]
MPSPIKRPGRLPVVPPAPLPAEAQELLDRPAAVDHSSPFTAGDPFSRLRHVRDEPVDDTEFLSAFHSGNSNALASYRRNPSLRESHLWLLLTLDDPGTNGYIFEHPASTDHLRQQILARVAHPGNKRPSIDPTWIGGIARDDASVLPLALRFAVDSGIVDAALSVHADKASEVDVRIAIARTLELPSRNATAILKAVRHQCSHNLSPQTLDLLVAAEGDLTGVPADRSAFAPELSRYPELPQPDPRYGDDRRALLVQSLTDGNDRHSIRATVSRIRGPLPWQDLTDAVLQGTPDLDAVKELCNRADSDNSFLTAAIGKFGFAIDFIATVSPERAGQILDAFDTNAATNSPHIDEAIAVLASRVVMQNPAQVFQRFGSEVFTQAASCVDISTMRSEHLREWLLESTTLDQSMWRNFVLSFPLSVLRSVAADARQAGSDAFCDLDLHLNTAATTEAKSHHFDRADIEILLACLVDWPDTMYELIGAISSSQYQWSSDEPTHAEPDICVLDSASEVASRMTSIDDDVESLFLEATPFEFLDDDEFSEFEEDGEDGEDDQEDDAGSGTNENVEADATDDDGDDFDDESPSDVLTSMPNDELAEFVVQMSVDGAVMELQEIPEQKLVEVLRLIEPKALAVLLARTPQSILSTFLQAVPVDSVPTRFRLDHPSNPVSNRHNSVQRLEGAAIGVRHEIVERLRSGFYRYDNESPSSAAITVPLKHGLTAILDCAIPDHTDALGTALLQAMALHPDSLPTLTHKQVIITRVDPNTHSMHLLPSDHRIIVNSIPDPFWENGHVPVRSTLRLSSTATRS